MSPDLLFLKVPEPKREKVRLHIDLRPEDQAAEVARAEAMGATRVDIGQGEPTWVVLADPEGNEFCILAPSRREELRPRLEGQPGLHAVGRQLEALEARRPG